MYERILVESTLTPSENKGMRSTSAAGDAVEPGGGVGGEEDRRAGMLGRANGQRGGLDAFPAGGALGSAAWSAPVGRWSVC